MRSSIEALLLPKPIVSGKMTTLRFLKPSRFPRIRAHPLPLALLTALAVGGRALGKTVLPAPGSSPRRGVSEDWGGRGERRWQ